MKAVHVLSRDQLPHEEVTRATDSGHTEGSKLVWCSNASSSPENSMWYGLIGWW
jgi:hypothetical protein